MQILDSLKNVFKIQELKKRIWMTVLLLAIFRLGSHITIPGVNVDAIGTFAQDAERGPYKGLWNMMQVMSGALGNLAIFALGIMPYITASIIMQLMTKVSPKLEAVAKEGPSGQRKINQYTRLLTVPVTLIQAIFTVRQLAGAGPVDAQGTPLLVSQGPGTLFMMVMALTAGALFVMWLGEQITEHGVGNGASLLIMANIVTRMPAVATDLLSKARRGDVSYESIIIVVALYVAIIAAVVFVTQAQRRIPIQHAKHFRGRRMSSGGRNYMPLRVNTAGVMPVIFASSLIMMPAVLGGFVPSLKILQEAFSMGSFFYTLAYVIMIFFFSYFWTYLFFQPVELANNLKEYGSFIPGIRPGENTAAFFNSILARITLCGAAFLCLIALLPDMITAAFGGEIQRQSASVLGGTGVLIVVGVALDVVQKIESYLLMHHYEGFVGSGGRIRGRQG